MKLSYILEILRLTQERNNLLSDNGWKFDLEGEIDNKNLDKKPAVIIDDDEYNKIIKEATCLRRSPHRSPRIATGLLFTLLDETAAAVGATRISQSTPVR